MVLVYVLKYHVTCQEITEELCSILQVVLVLNILIITDTSPPKHYSRTSPDVTEEKSGPSSTILCAPQKYLILWSIQCAFTKRPSDAAIGKSPCDTAIPSDMPRLFIHNRFLCLRYRSQGDIPLLQEVCGRPGGWDS